MLNFPATPSVGDTLELDGVIWAWDGAVWTHAEGASTGISIPRISTGEFPPATPSSGDLWFDPTEGQLYIYFDDGTSSQWVVTINQGGGGGGAPGLYDAFTTTGTGTVLALQQGPTINQPLVMGITDGSNATPGEVGELITNTGYFVNMGTTAGAVTTIITISLPPGDWDVFGFIWCTVGSTTITAGSCGCWVTTSTMTSIPTFSIGTISAALARSASNELDASGSMGPVRYNLTVSTTIYLRAQAYWLAGTASGVSANGVLRARRVR